MKSAPKAKITSPGSRNHATIKLYYKIQGFWNEQNHVHKHPVSSVLIEGQTVFKGAG